MLTGLMPLSGGDCKIFGMSVKHEMAEISKVMGVCPQHDVLWDNLTGREHLELFARLKAIPDADIPAQVEARLRDVKLEEGEDHGVASPPPPQPPFFLPCALYFSCCSFLLFLPLVVAPPFFE